MSSLPQKNLGLKDIFPKELTRIIGSYAYKNKCDALTVEGTKCLDFINDKNNKCYPFCSQVWLYNLFKLIESIKIHTPSFIGVYKIFFEGLTKDNQLTSENIGEFNGKYFHYWDSLQSKYIIDVPVFVKKYNTKMDKKVNEDDLTQPINEEENEDYQLILNKDIILFA